MRRNSPLLILIWLGWTSAHADIGGMVFDSANQVPLAGVQITVEASGIVKQMPTATANDGSFFFDPKALFSSTELDTLSLVLTFKRADYRDIIRVFRSNTRGRFDLEKLRVPMERNAGAAAIPPVVRDPLRRQRSATGTTLFVVPYEFQGNDATGINNALMFHLKRGINTHLQSVNMPSISIARFPVEVDTFNTEQVRAYGTELNALAVVSGIGSVAGGAQNDSVDVASEYVIIPATSSYTARTLYVDDRFARADLQSTRLFQRLQRLWGQNTVLAMSLREAQLAKQAGDKAGMKRAIEFVQAEKRQAGPESAELVREMDAFIAALKRELQ